MGIRPTGAIESKIYDIDSTLFSGGRRNSAPVIAALVHEIAELAECTEKSIEILSRCLIRPEEGSSVTLNPPHSVHEPTSLPTVVMRFAA